ncbi:MAG: hypothetical protein KDB18_08490, partial [Salinibacterium sp.]|nr:hypothetical protein [Salinibacterium sp.]
ILPGVLIVMVGHALLARFPDQHHWRIMIATGWRWGDMLLWAARYAVVFILVGEPVTWARATQFALISQIALVIPLVGNGLGLREWAIGAFAGRGSGEPQSLAQSAAVGVTADLVNRAAELIVLVPLGALAGVLLARRARAAGASLASNSPA